jgi:hypothetical protein
MRLVAALLIALMPTGAFAQSATTDAGQGSNPSGTTYGGGSAYGGGSSGYDGGGIDSVTTVRPRSKVQPPNMGGNYGYGDTSKPAQPR